MLCSLTPAHSFRTSQADLQIKFHGIDPSALLLSSQKENRWPDFTPPAAGLFRRYRGRLLHRRSQHHRCIGWRPAPRIAPYRWEFQKDGKAFDIAVEPQITSNDLRFLLRTALAGGGITFATADTFEAHVARGELVSLLEDYLPPFPGFYLYFPQRSDLSPKLKAMVDHVRMARRAG